MAQARKKKTPIRACGICGQSGHNSRSHDVGGRLYSPGRIARRGGNVLGRRKKAKR